VLDLSRITLVTVATREHAVCREAIAKLREVARFGKVIVFTNAFESYPEYRRSWVASRGWKDWCVWRLTEFPKFRYEFSDFILFVESDAAIVNPAAWTDKFFEWDYIGAPWHDRVVGNGGFTLISQKFLAALDKLDLPPTVEACHPCDFKMCCDYRAWFEGNDCKFAPAEVADRFANETGDYLGAFGVHSRYMLDLARWKAMLSQSPAGRV